MLHKSWAVLSVLLVVGGVSMLLYPLYSGWAAENRQDEVIRTYQTDLKEFSRLELERARAEAQAYNRQLSQTVRLSEKEGEGVWDLSYEQLLNENRDGIMSYIEIPKIGVNLPVYHGTSEAVLAKGAGHMQNTALPVGGATTHCVISAHCGDPSATLFTDLDQLREEDMFYLHTLDEVLCYKVDQIKVVLPDETKEFGVVEGKDHVTLVTCTPYGINSHRLLVRGERVNQSEMIQNQLAGKGNRCSVGVRQGNAILCTAGMAKEAVQKLIQIDDVGAFIPKDY